MKSYYTSLQRHEEQILWMNELSFRGHGMWCWWIKFWKSSFIWFF